MNKNQFRDEVKNLSTGDLWDRFRELELLLIKAGSLSSTGQNPYVKCGVPVKNIKWQRVIIITELKARGEDK